MGFVWDTVVDQIEGNGKVQAVSLRNLQTGAVERRSIDGVFIFIGHYPNSELYQGQLELDDRGYLKVDPNLMTSVPGVFAAGEIMDPHFRQIATSVGQGAAAGMMVERWIEDPDDFHG
jgi:thioredoxin reductase (NADPH)